MRRKLMLSAIVALLALMVTLSLQAQVTTATLFGTVADKTGATIVGAQVTARNVDTNFSRTVPTSDQGDYRIEFLPVGNYVLETTAKGFSKSVQKNITLGAMAVGNVSEEVVVTSDAPLVETGQAALGTTIELNQVANLPLVDRNVYSLLTLTPGVQSSSATATIPSIVLGYPEQRTMINGGVDGGAGSVSYYLDGGINMTGIRNTGNIAPNPDSIQEFRIETNNYKAEFGRFGSGVVNILTKSGTNNFHGSLSEYIRNTNLNAYAWGADPKQGKPGMHRNSFGATFGGPIVKDKTFFFFSYAGLRMTQDSLLTGSVLPTNAQRGLVTANVADFSTTPLKAGAKDYLGNTIVGNQIPFSGMDPTALYILNHYIPVAGTQQLSKTPYDTDEFLFKVDHALTSKHQLAASYFETSGNNANNPGGNMLWSLQKFNWRQHNGNVSDTWVISPNKVNQIWATYTRMFGGRVNTCSATAVSSTACTSSDMSLNDITHAAAPTATNIFTPQGVPSLPQITVTGLFTLGQAIGGPVAGTNFYSVRDVFSYTRGRHAFKFGGELSLNKDVMQTLLNNYGTFTFSGGTTGNALADFLVGKPSATNQDSPVTAYDNSWYTAIFAQDDFRVLPRVMLNLGVRWDVQTPPTDDSQNREATFVPGVQSTMMPTAPTGVLVVGDPGVTRGTIPMRWHHVSPRVGLAWDVFGDGKTSVRAGAGVFYGSVSGNEWNQTSNFNPFAVRYPFPAVGTLTNPYTGLAGGVSPFPFVYDPKNPKFLPSAQIEGVSLNFQYPYTYQFNMSVQQQLGKDTSVSIAYVGTLAHNLPLAIDQNYPVMSTLAGTPNKTTGVCPTTGLVAASAANAPCRRPILPGVLGAVMIVQSNQFASYHGLQATLTKKMGHHISFSSFYTYSHSLTSAELQNNTTNPSQAGLQPQDYNNMGAEKSRGDFDMRHQFSFSGVWSPDYYTGDSRVVRALANGWSISPIITLRSGLPFAIYTGKDNNYDGIANNDRPNLVPGVSPYLSNPGVSAWFNTAAFVANPAGTDGNVPREFMSGPGTRNVDLAISRSFAINERFKLTARAEALNAFNMVSLNAPNGTVTSPQFGVITSAQAMRRMQFGLKLTY
jgi:hypothetical protein